VTLTPYGTRVRDALGPRYTDLAAAVREVTIDAGRVAGPLHVGFLGLSGGPHPTALVESFQQRHPACTVDLVDFTLADPIGRLRSSQGDVMTCWVPIDEPGVVVGPLFLREPRAVAVAVNHPLARRSAVVWDDLAEYPVADVPGLAGSLRETLIPSATSSGLPLRRGVTIHSMAEVFSAVARGRIVHPTTTNAGQFYGHPDLLPVPLADAEPLRSAFVRRDEPPSPRPARVPGGSRVAGCATWGLTGRPAAPTGCCGHGPTRGGERGGAGAAGVDLPAPAG